MSLIAVLLPGELEFSEFKPTQIESHHAKYQCKKQDFSYMRILPVGCFYGYSSRTVATSKVSSGDGERDGTYGIHGTGG